MAIILLNTATQSTGEINTTAYGTAVSVVGATNFSAQILATVDTPVAKTFTDTNVNVGTDTITITAHGFTTGLKGQFTSTGTLPAGLSLSTDYFIIVVTANTLKVATSLALALAGTAVDITGQGTVAATNTFTPTAIAGANVKLQKSNDGVTFSDEGSATNITVTATIWLEKTDPAAIYMRLAYTLTAGQMICSALYAVKGPV